MSNKIGTTQIWAAGEFRYPSGGVIKIGPLPLEALFFVSLYNYSKR